MVIKLTWNYLCTKQILLYCCIAHLQPIKVWVFRRTMEYF